jgi:hypothetical protein
MYAIHQKHVPPPNLRMDGSCCKRDTAAGWLAGFRDVRRRAVGWNAYVGLLYVSRRGE